MRRAGNWRQNKTRYGRTVVSPQESTLVRLFFSESYCTTPDSTPFHSNHVILPGSMEFTEHLLPRTYSQRRGFVEGNAGGRFSDLLEANDVLRRAFKASMAGLHSAPKDVSFDKRFAAEVLASIECDARGQSGDAIIVDVFH